MRALIPLALLFALPARADVCLQIDDARDTLNEVDRKGVLALAASSFEEQDEKVVPAPCTRLYTLANVRLGNSVTATLNGPEGTLRGQATSIEDLGNVYDQLIRSMLSGKPVDEVLTRNNVTDRQANPNRLKADSLYTVRIGPGYVMESDIGEVPFGLGFGYRYELDHWAVEAGFDMTLSLGDQDEDKTGAHFGGYVGALYFIDGEENTSPYVGAALGYGGTVVSNLDHTWSGGGLEGRFAAGYALFRASTIRMFVEFDVTLPLYDLEYDGGFGSGDPPVDDSLYAPVFGLNLGIGYDP